ncbi:sigma-70 family RNA polymerase sigma factor [Streptomyces chartreusis]|uniref:sigma-70 family RNA polymerase sigma factor n=1 Tax=Streptomyces chartreusis TaxID=1969 RepID=UPI0038022919
MGFRGTFTNSAEVDAKHSPQNCDVDIPADLMDRFYREHASSLMAYILYRFTADRQQAEDVVQETMLRAWKNRSRLHSIDGSIRPWLCTVARNIAIDRHRSRSAKELLISFPAEGNSATDETERILISIVLHNALNSISQAHRDVLIQTYFKGAAPAQAAIALGIPVGTVRSRIFYALRSMKMVLEEQGFATTELTHHHNVP